MSEADNPTKDLKDYETQQVNLPDAGHSYGFGNESINEQFKELSASGDLADLKREVEQIKERLSAVEAALSKITQQPTGEPAKKAAVKKPPAQSHTMSRKAMQDQENRYQESLRAQEVTDALVKDTVRGDNKSRKKKA